MVFADTACSPFLQPALHSNVELDPAMFNNNNNYLPNLNQQFGPVGQLLHVSTVTPTQPAGPTMGLPPTSLPYQPLGTFRFLSPTQGTAVPTWAPPASSMCMAAAPGVGVSWQHSVPATMPWANHTPPNFNAEVASPLSATVLSNLQQPFAILNSSPHTGDRVTHISPFEPPVCQQRKRHSKADDVQEGPKSKRYLSEKMASWFQQLQITPVEQDDPNTYWNTGQDKGWQRFCEIERRLEQDIDEEEIEDQAKDDRSDKPRLVFTEGVDEIRAPNPVLPQAILSKITKPCMELVLYREPKSLVLGSVSDNSEAVSMNANTESDKDSYHQSHDQQLPSMTNEHPGPMLVNGVELAAVLLRRPASDTEMFDSLDDEMDL